MVQSNTKQMKPYFKNQATLFGGWNSNQSYMSFGDRNTSQSYVNSIVIIVL